MNSYIEAGLTALGRNAELTNNTWFMGHIGAAVIAGGLLLENDAMPDDARALLRSQLDRVIEENAAFFVHFDTEQQVPLTALLNAIEHSCSELSTSGHGVIYGALVLRALKMCPAMASRQLIDGIIRTLQATRN